MGGVHDPEAGAEAEQYKAGTKPCGCFVVGENYSFWHEPEGDVFCRLLKISSRQVVRFHKENRADAPLNKLIVGFKKPTFSLTVRRVNETNIFPGDI